MPESTGKNISRRVLIRRLAALLSCSLLAAGCSLNYEQAALEEKVAEGIPDTVLVGVVHKIHKGGRLTMEVEAARAETYNDRKQTILTDSRFTEFDAQGGKATEGQAGRIVFHSDTENAEISGAVKVHSATEKGAVTADSLMWQNKEKLLSAPLLERVLLKKDDGSYISGTGFQGDFNRRELTFSGPVQGTYVWEDKKE
jgi:LPS export ABC transporter protein LptC